MGFASVPLMSRSICSTGIGGASDCSRGAGNQLTPAHPAHSAKLKSSLGCGVEARGIGVEARGGGEEARGGGEEARGIGVEARGVGEVARGVGEEAWDIGEEARGAGNQLIPANSGNQSAILKESIGVEARGGGVEARGWAASNSSRIISYERSDH